MKAEYDFSKGTRGRAVKPEPEPAGKVRITIRLDEDLVDHFMAKADESGGNVGYQTLINNALREYIAGVSPLVESALRRVLEEHNQRKVAG